MPFLFVPVRGREALRRARVRTDLWAPVLSGYWAPHIYVVSLGDGPEEADVHARMFAPAMGIEEDPATGAAATALAGYLVPRDDAATGTLRWRVRQGAEMGRPSLMEVEADAVDGVATAVRVGGSSVLVGEGSLEAPRLP